MEDFVTGCLHFAHRNICLHASRMPWIYANPNYYPDKKYHFKFNNPWSVDIKMHDEALIENWNKVVGRKDRVFILGDLAFNNHAHYIQALNGKRKIITLGNHDKMNSDSLSLFAEVHEMGCRKKIQGQDVTFCHYGMRTWASSVHGSWQLYSHSHGRLPEFDNMYSFDVGVDVWGYAPVLWLVIVEKMRLIKEKIEARGGRYVNGEHAAKAIYSKDPNQRMLDTRKKNKAIMASLGYEINEAMWPEELICLPTAA